MFGTFSKDPNTSEGFQDLFKDLFPGLSVQSALCEVTGFSSSNLLVAGDGELGSNASPHRSRSRTDSSVRTVLQNSWSARM